MTKDLSFCHLDLGNQVMTTSAKSAEALSPLRQAPQPMKIAKPTRGMGSVMLPYRINYDTID